MPLFRRNNQALKFDIVGLTDEAMKEITVLVVQNGGKVVHDDMQPIKFTKPFQFVHTAFPGSRLYDIEFIKDCIAKKKIVDAMQYRIGKPFLYDDCLMAHFLGAKSDCCTSNLCTELTEGNAQNSSTETRVADNVRDNPRRVQLRPPIQTTDNSENLSRKKVTAERSNRASDIDPEIKIEVLSSSPKRRPELGDNEKILQASRKGRRRGRGVAITRPEEISILKYLTTNHVILEAATGLQVWEEIIKSGICTHRTANSLYSHFKKSMVPNITRYAAQLTEKQLKKFNKIKDM